MKSRKERLHNTLTTNFEHAYIDIENQSHQHHVPVNSATHFKVVLVSSDFLNQPRINRHRMINDALKEEFNSGLHALSLHLYTPQEWESRGQSSSASPSCRGGLHNE